MDNSKLHILAVVGVIERGREVLLLKRAPHEIAFPNQYTLPGGKVERGFLLKETLRKEIREETGLEVGERMDFVCDRTFERPDGFNVVSLTFCCSYIRGKVVISRDFTDFKWASREDLDKDTIDIIPEIKEDLLKFIF